MLIAFRNIASTARVLVSNDDARMSYDGWNCGPKVKARTVPFDMFASVEGVLGIACTKRPGGRVGPRICRLGIM